jgi:hypothetical protein
MNVMDESVSLASVCDDIRQHLEDERHRINEEIRNYPTPAQFNYLLEQQKEIVQELGRWKELRGEGLAQPDYVGCIGELLAASKHINPEAEQRIRSSILAIAQLER